MSLRRVNMARIIVACGSGVATSQAVASKVNRMLKADGIDSEVEAVDIKSLKMYIRDADIYISIVKNDEDFGIPVISGIPFLTGRGMDKEYAKLKDAIAKVDANKKH